MGVGFKIIARTSIPNVITCVSDPKEDDLTEFWDLPTNIKEEEELFDNQHLMQAIDLHIERKSKTQVQELSSVVGPASIL